MKDIVIDGYNLLHAMGGLKTRAGPTGLEKARLRLLGLLKASFADQASSVTVVFDARQAPSGIPQQTSHQGIKIHFARGEEADDVVETIIAGHSSPKSLTVVSDDQRLRRAATQRRACSMNCHDFLQFLNKRRQHLRTNPPEKAVRLSPAETQQLLDDFAHLDEELKREFELFDFGEEP